MRIFFIAFTIAMCMAGPRVLGQEEDNRRKGYSTTSLPGGKFEWQFTCWGDAILVDNVMINGKGPFRFMLDTGAEGAGRVDNSLVKKLNLPESGNVTGRSILGESSGMTIRKIDTLSIGTLTFEGLTMPSRDYNSNRPAGLRPIDGILGYHLFNDYLLTINYPTRTITVNKGELPPPDGKSVLPIVSDDDDPEIQITIGNQPAKALIDTGAMLHMAVPESMVDKLEFESGLKVIGRNGGATIRTGTLAGSLHIGNVVIASPETIIAGRIREANIGIKILAKLAVTFDQKNKRVCIGQPPRRKGYGLAIAMRDGGSGPESLHDVIPGSIADLAGVRKTDQLIAINDHKLSEIDREDFFNMHDLPNMKLTIKRDGKRIDIVLSKEKNPSN